MADSAELVEQTKRIQKLMLDDFEYILTPDENGKSRCSPTDRATVARWLMMNNYKVDEATVPKALRDLVADVRSARGNPPRHFPDAAKLPGE